MNYLNKNLKYIQSLVGNITEDDLSCVDVYVHKTLGIFIPSIGFCKYAIKANHTHPSYSFTLFFSEKDSMIVPSIDIPSDSYFCCAMSPDIPHEESKSENFHRYIAIFIDENFFKKQLSFYTENVNEKYFWSQFTLNKNILNHIKDFMSEYEENYNNCYEMLDSLSILITNELIRGLLKIKSNNNSNNITNTEILNAIEYMHINFSDKITLKTLCSISNMSESNFNKLFKEQTGLSPIKYLINLRINKAKKFLRNTDFSITDVSMKCGFYSVSHFSSRFMNAVNLSPTEYQNLFHTK
ncbi:helix-turn-helix transcriptional regulator [uncultured Clostridium sp.]|uniref:helix-turn-helix transcriptional regulator n=1 Tax=uncultured Clostridium sp. TaxID=59620 RepID=UPI0025E399F9|nr:AraC family transcriptional regulator [uncultured Clostridium sp.]